jgi:hypothetical protein
MLDAVDTYIQKKSNILWLDANFISFRLDGAVYTAVENPDDGYRSMMDRLFVTLDIKMKNVFPAVKVVGLKRAIASDDVIEFIDVKTKKIVLEIGTDHQDDYYPSFVSAFHPENMTTNADK